MKPRLIVDPPGVLKALRKLEFRHKLGILDRLFGQGLSAHGVCWIHTAAGLPWKLDMALPTHRWIVYGKYEGAAFLDWARRHLPRDGIVVDSGANIGQMLLYLAQWVPQGRVFAFEPGEAAAAWLRECLDANPQLPVELIRCALGSEECEMALEPIGAAHVHGACNQVRPAGEGPAIRVRRLADVLREHAVARVDLWKLDVEGYEVEAIEGARELIAARGIRAIYAELAFGRGEEIRSSLERLGYCCHLFDRSGGLHVPGALPPHINGLFLPR